MSTTTFTDRTALITGGNSGIGLATARALIEAGARVLIHGRNQETLDAAVAELGERAHGVRGDVAKPNDLDALMTAARDHFGHLDILFANAGIAEFPAFADTDEATFDRITDVNYKGTFFTIQKALPLLAEGAAVVVNTSVVNVKGWPGMSAYAPTKAALRSLVRVLAAEFAPKGIRINAIAPGAIETPIYGRLGMDEASTQAFAEQIKSMVPLARFGTSEDIAQAVLALIANPYITGAELPVDGGVAQV